MKTYKCPYCLHQFTKNEAIDVKINNHITAYQCPNSSLDDLGRPTCSKNLPLDFFESESIVISFVGSISVGKTYYRTALLEQIRLNNALHKLGIWGDVIGSEAELIKIKEQINNITNLNFLDATKKGDQKETLVIRVNILKGKSRKCVYFSFFDNPGEGITDKNYLMKNLHNIYLSDAIVYLIDPRQIKFFLGKINLNNETLDSNYSVHNVVQNYSVYDTLGNVADVLNVIQKNNDVKKAQKSWAGFISDAKDYFNITEKHPKVKIPVAFCLSKFDEVEHNFYCIVPEDNQRSLETTLLYNNKINFQLMDSINKDIRDVIYNDEDGDFRLKHTLDTRFANYKWFATQTIKFEAQGGYKMNPKGVLMPILWLFKQLNLLN